MRLDQGARVAIVGAGPSGIVAAKHALDAGFEATVFEASDRLGGQWHADAPHSGVWPGMHTNTSRAMTAFSDSPAPPDHPLHPAAEQIHAYLDRYARTFGVLDRVRFEARVAVVRPGSEPARSGSGPARPKWVVDGEPFDAVIVASGRFRKPSLPAVVAGFRGELLHAFDYPGGAAFKDRAVLVYGNGISGLEIASDLAPHAPVISAFRKSRYVIQKVVDGVSSDWQWYTLFGALERRLLPADACSRRQRQRVLRVAGNPADFGAPAPDADLRVAGISLCQDYLAQVRDGSIACRPEIARIDGRRVMFVDGSSADFEAIICATGYDLEVPYLGESAPGLFSVKPTLYELTFHPDYPGLGVIGMFLLQGPYFPLLELQARWIAAAWSGEVTLPSAERMREALARPRPAIEAHNVLALTLSERLGVSPEPLDWPALTEPLVFGPMLPARYRLSGPGARADAEAQFAHELASAPRARVDPLDLEALNGFGWNAVAAQVSTALGVRSGSTAPAPPSR